MLRPHTQLPRLKKVSFSKETPVCGAVMPAPHHHLRYQSQPPWGLLNNET